MSRFYLVAAILGALVPYLFFFGWIQDNGLALGGFIQALFVNGAAGGFSADLLIASFVFWGFMAADDAAAVVGRPWLYIFVNLTIGLSCALPLYLYFRTRAPRTAAAA